MIKREVAALLVTAMLCGASPAHAAPVQWQSGAGGNDHFYEVFAVAGGIDWTHASSAAASAGGYLVTLTSRDEDSFVFEFARQLPAAWQLDGNGNGRGPWLGGVQSAGAAEPDGGWQWLHGEGPFVFTNWEAAQPNDSGGIEDSLQFFARGQLIADTWNDAAGIRLHPGYVVEFDVLAAPLPASNGLLISAITAALAAARRRQRRGIAKPGSLYL